MLKHYQHLLQNNPEYHAHREFWIGQLGRMTAPLRLADFLHLENESPVSRTHVLCISEANRELVRRLGKGKDAGEFVILLSALVILLRRYSGQETIHLSSPPLADLDEQGQIDHLVPLVFHGDEDAPLRQFITGVQQTVTQSYTYQDFPVSMLPGAGTGLHHGPVLVRHDGLHTSHRAPASHDLVFRMPASGHELLVEDHAGLLSDGFVRRMEGHLGNVLAQYDSLDTPLAELRLLGEDEERELLVELNRTEVPRFRDVSSLKDAFEACVRESPDQSAVIANDVELTYSGLNARANQLAHHLREELGIRPGETVAVLSDRSELAIVALLGVLKAGAVYLPVSPEHPRDRVRSMFRDADVEALLLHSMHLDGMLDFYDIPTFCLDLQMGTLATPASDLDVQIAPEDLAAIVYTSGSDGQPKGVLLTHAGLANVALDHIEELDVGRMDRYLQFMALSFDGSLLDIFTGILSGAVLVMVRDETLQDVKVFQDYLNDKRVTIFTMTPSYLKLLDPERLTGVRTIISAAEVARPSDAEFHSRSKDFYNGYGPSEACVNATLHKVEPQRRYASVPIGKPRANKKIYVLDARRRLLPRGVVGEFAISGWGLARGYLNDPELTRRKFVSDPFIDSQRMYLSGDLGAWNDRGELCFKGRRDHQIKVRGFRIEPGEIEKNLLSHPSVRDAVVLFDSRHERLVAFVTKRQEVTEGNLFEHLRTKVPDYMRPVAIHGLDAFPLTPNGKVDHRALLELDARNLHHPRTIPPENELEEILIDIWQQVLELPQISTDADFFRLGGDSIRIIQAVFEAHKEHINIDTVDIIKHRTVRNLAQHIQANGLRGDRTQNAPSFKTTGPSEEERRELPGTYEDVYPVSRMQELMLAKYADPACSANGSYHCVASWHVQDSSFSLGALEAALGVLERRHRSLRTAFFRSKTSGRLLQAIRVPTGELVSEHDLRDLSEEDQWTAIRRVIRSDIDRKYELDGLGRSFVRFYVLVRSNRSFQLIMSAHHAVIDGWSVVELENDLFDLYTAFKAGRAPLAEVAPVDSYREFVALEQEISSSETFASFWRRELADAADNSLPEKHTFQPGDAFGMLVTGLDTELSSELHRTAVERGVSLKAVCLSAFLSVLHRHLQQPRVTVGLIANGRSEALTNPLRTTGLFWNIVPFRSDLRHHEDVAPLDELQSRLHQIEHHARYPLACMLEDTGKQELFTTCFNFINFHNTRASFDGIQILGFDGHDRFHYPLTFVVAVSPQAGTRRLELRVEYHRAYFAEEEVKDLVATYVHEAGKLARQRDLVRPGS